MLEVGTGFHPELTGRENVYMNGAILGMTKAEIDRKFDQIVEFAEMEKFIDTPVKRYSSGMYVKLAFAVAGQRNHGYGRGSRRRRYEVPAKMPRQNGRCSKYGRPYRALCQP